MTAPRPWRAHRKGGWAAHELRDGSPRDSCPMARPDDSAASIAIAGAHLRDRSPAGSVS